MSNYRSTLVGLALITMASVLPSSAQAQQRSKVGTLACKLAPSIGLIIGSSQRMTCRFTPDGKFPTETYVGVMNRIGLDIGITAGGASGMGGFCVHIRPGPRRSGGPLCRRQRRYQCRRWCGGKRPVRRLGEHDLAAAPVGRRFGWPQSGPRGCRSHADLGAVEHEDGHGVELKIGNACRNDGDCIRRLFLNSRSMPFQS